MSNNNLPTVGGWLKEATNKLRSAGVTSSRLDAIIILEDILTKDRAYLLAHPEEVIKNNLLADLNNKLARRLNREPLAYIRGFVEFWGQKIIVTPDVLIPRPESESFLELLSKLELSQNKKLLDIGTGSGALAIGAKLQHPALDVSACDISESALKVAELNSSKLNLDINFFACDLNACQLADYDILCANLPYVPFDYKVSEEVNQEPPTAIFSDDNGLKHIKLLASRLNNKFKIGGYVLIESLVEQQPEVLNLIRTIGFELWDKKGLVQMFEKVK